MNAKTLARFWSKVDKSGDCWIWIASKRAKGYGAFVWADSLGIVVQGRAHRFAWILANGPIPAGKCVLHACDTPACVNPAHLFLGTRRDNNDDMRRKGRGKRGRNASQLASGAKYSHGSRHHMAKLTEFSALEILHASASGVSYSAIAKRYGIGITTVHRVVTRKTWKHVQTD